MNSILSLDPGFARLGYCLSNSVPIKFGCLETSSKDLFEQRLLYIHNWLESFIKDNNVELLIYEAPIGLKGDNGYKLAQVVGLINVLAAKYKAKLITYSATQVKRIVVGTGKANKQDVEAAIRKIYDIKEKLVDDTADAIANFACYKIMSEQQINSLINFIPS